MDIVELKLIEERKEIKRKLKKDKELEKNKKHPTLIGHFLPII